MAIHKSQIIVIVGPTASGKSDISNKLGLNIGGEVVSADSMQIYKGMDIGTGKINKDDMLVEHWGLDIVNPDQAYSAALYQDYSRKCFKDIWQRNSTPILCGGTGFYIRAAIDDYKFCSGEQTDNEIRDKYSEYLKNNGAHKLWLLLEEKDKDSASIIHENNSVRVIRALELHEIGESYYKQAQNLSNIKQKYDAIFFGLDVDSSILYKRINNRVDQMINDGLIDEVKSLLEQGYNNALTASSAIGYKEIVQYLKNDISLDEAINEIKLASRHYAKRQKTWFRKDNRIKWILYNKPDIDKAVNEIISCCGINQ